MFADGAAVALESGMIHYRSLSRKIEFAARRGNGEVVVMGEEAFVPRPPHPLAERTLRRRFTDVWVKADNGWKLDVRQATIFNLGS